ncbi:MAG: histidine kinase [Erysipelotrichaceae bacterium]|nr:histidine kinase [Erysipelotrichaceae bacterium]
MELDQLLNLTSTVSGKLLPILGATVLVFLIVFVRRLILVLTSTNEAIHSLKKTLDSAGKQLDALDKPMQTLNEISETVDNVHEASKSVIRSLLSSVIDNVGTLVKKSSKKNNNCREQDTEDIYQRGEDYESEL